MDHRQLNRDEKVVWEGTPSQWVNFGVYIKWLLWTAAWISGLIAALLNEELVIGFVHAVPALQAISLDPLPFLAGIVAGAALVATACSLWSYLQVKTSRFVLTTERLFTHKGVLSKQIDELELYRIKDYAQFKPFVMRLAGLGCVSVETSDRSHPHVSINGIKEPDVLQGLLRKHGEKCRNTRGVREVDM
ncbi:PH domain-containing protein [Pseudomonas amygdali]|uniref:YdbS-like PH domain-containing protein n=1 Tax=Pseudomonas amygdali pv. lachrymans TaxID=53707 RepID=A0ABR5KRR4_PSEAV|nr:PH domain-containing protein [Pseudomonas amygdali]KPC17318.1 Uncharacterized protein AC499_0520 [Pseudomonas amygdali pv. lachrymans]RMT05948.1 hypothetical protein ALP54_03780 [Pseudomonas amygdali pv. lachrymans]